MLIPDVGVTLGADTRLYRRLHNRGTSIGNSEVCAHSVFKRTPEYIMREKD